MFLFTELYCRAEHFESAPVKEILTVRSVRDRRK
jgi:hypothetical protein